MTLREDHEVIRFATRADGKACNDFYNRMYGRQRTLEQWEWEFCGHSDDPAAYVLMERDGVVLGTQAFIPIQMIDASGVFLTAKSEETLLDPSMRGKGILERMYGLLFARAETMSIAAIWGFTPAVKAFNRLGFDVPGKTAQLLMLRSATGFDLSDTDRQESVVAALRRASLRSALTLARLWSRVVFQIARRTLGASRSVQTKVVDSAPTEAGALMHSFVTQWGGCTIYRDSEYLHWRVFSNPWLAPRVICAYVENGLAGWVVYSSGADGLGHIVDIVASDVQTTRAGVSAVVSTLLLRAVEDLEDTGSTAIRAWTVTSHPFDQLVQREAKKLGFLRVNRGNPVVRWCAGEPTARASLSDFDAWYITRIYTEGTNG